jgi:hypothetical protein
MKQVEMKSIPVQRKPFDLIACDILGPFETSKHKNKYIVVFTEYGTKWAIAVATSNIDSKTIAHIFIREVVLKFGTPTKFLTDQGTMFVSNLIHDICEILGVIKMETSAYHPQTDGQTERFNKTLLNMLSHYSSNRNWDEYLDFAIFAYNSSPHDGSKYSPFFLNFGRDPVFPIDTIFKPNYDVEKSWIQTIGVKSYYLV